MKTELHRKIAGKLYIPEEATTDSTNYRWLRWLSGTKKHSHNNFLISYLAILASKIGVFSCCFSCEACPMTFRKHTVVLNENADELIFRWVVSMFFGDVVRSNMKPIVKVIHKPVSKKSPTNMTEKYGRNKRKRCLAILCDLFGMVKWPFSMVKWPPIRGWKGHFESPGKGSCWFTGIQCKCQRRERNLRSLQCRPQRVIKWC